LETSLNRRTVISRLSSLPLAFLAYKNSDAQEPDSLVGKLDLPDGWCLLFVDRDAVDTDALTNALQEKNLKVFVVGVSVPSGKVVGDTIASYSISSNCPG
jgi:hypothetical protein